MLAQKYMYNRMDLATGSEQALEDIVNKYRKKS